MKHQISMHKSNEKEINIVIKISIAKIELLLYFWDIHFQLIFF